VQPFGAFSSPISAGADGSQYLTFRLGDEEYGVEILKVQEIRSYATITPVPNTPRAVKGVMNLRGQIIPVVDLRTTFGMPETAYTRFAVVIVAVIAGKVVGLLADGVSDVLTVAKTDIQAAPDFGTPVEARLISGMAKAGEKLVILLEVERLLEGDTTDWRGPDRAGSRPPLGSSREDDGRP
jgi:purine-binding chemotaxis protein CheW